MTPRRLTPGALDDLMAQLIGQRLSDRLGQQFVTPPWRQCTQQFLHALDHF
jgi:hypothetical protein